MAIKWAAIAAAENLKKKTNLPWTSKEDPPKSANYVIVMESQIKSPSWKEGETSFKKYLENKGIDFAPTVLATQRGQPQGSVMIQASISNQLEIDELSKNKFTYPSITREESLNAVEVLQKKTQLPWNIKESNGKVTLNLVTEVNGKSWEEGEALFKNKLNASGINFNVDVTATKRGAKENFVNIFANISNPLAIRMLSSINKQNTQIASPSKNSGGPVQHAQRLANRSVPALLTNYSDFKNSEQRGNFIKKYLELPPSLKDEVLKGQTYDDLIKLQDSMTRYFPDYRKKYSDGYNEIHAISDHLTVRQSRQKNMAELAADYLRQNPSELRKLFANFKGSEQMVDFDLSVNKKGSLHIKGLNRNYEPPKLYEIDVDGNKVKHYASIEPASKQTLVLARKLNEYYKTAAPQSLQQAEKPEPIAPPRGRKA